MSLEFERRLAGDQKRIEEALGPYSGRTTGTRTSRRPWSQPDGGGESGSGPC